MLQKQLQRARIDGWKLPLSISFLGVTLDLFSTWVGIGVYHAVEINPLGNQPFIEYPVVLGSTLILCFLKDYFIKKTKASTRTQNVWTLILWLYISQPFIAYLHNLLAIGGIL